MWKEKDDSDTLKLTMSKMNPFKYISVETGSEEGGVHFWSLLR